MAQKRIYICDKCKLEIIEDSKLPSTWREILIHFTQYDKKSYAFCPDCLKDIGFINTSGRQAEIPSFETKLFDVLADIVNSIIDDRGL